MPVALTSQEKKVLGFIAVMVLLGLVMLVLKRFDVLHREGAKTAKETSISK